MATSSEETRQRGNALYKKGQLKEGKLAGVNVA